ncbi:MAG: hypothetical protein LW823_03990 [Rickettsiales bacterium]|jgi:hypothetical protein|nr:hypothetical protein [Rickettsiales bacterium]
MALIHFAFGRYARDGDIDTQVTNTCEMILGPRKLRAASCPEFIPILNTPNSISFLPESAQRIPNGVRLNKLVPSPPISLLREDILMLCFSDLALSKLKNWPCLNHYAQLAIVFTDMFKKRIGARPVHYYELAHLPNDRKVIEFNQASNQGIQSEKIQKLKEELLIYRKPKVMWPEFRKLYGVIRVSQTNFKVITYDDYTEGYNFSAEYEARVIMNKEKTFIQFEEKDVLKIFAPTIDAKLQLTQFLTKNWKQAPLIELFPKT